MQEDFWYDKGTRLIISFENAVFLRFPSTGKGELIVFKANGRKEEKRKGKKCGRA